VALAGVVYLVLIAIYARPIADDWGFLSASDHLSFGGYLAHYWNTASDRYSSFALILITVRMFGDQAVNALSLGLLVLLWTTATYAVRLGSTRVSTTEAAGAGLLTTVAICASAPSLFDTLGWLNSTGFYLAGFTAAVGIVCLVARNSRVRPRSRVARGSTVFMLAAICAGFMELVGAVLVLAAVLMVVLERGSSKRSADRLGSIRSAGAGAAAGTVINLLGPGTRLRETAQHAHLSFAAAADTAGHNLSFVYGDIHDGVLLLWLAAGIVVWLLCGPVAHGQRLRLLAWTGFLLLVPWLVTSALTAWGGSTESDDRSPFRAAFLITGSVTVAVILLTIAVVSLAPSRLSGIRGTIAALLLVIGGVFAVAHKASPVLHAERLREHAVQLRSVSVGRQLRAAGGSITLYPAPLLTVETQAYDLSFAPASQQRSWIITFLRGYYDIPAHDTVTLVARQPHDYCISGVAASWVGVRSCQELDAARRGGGSKRSGS
jgi:hypothetical protein